MTSIFGFFSSILNPPNRMVYSSVGNLKQPSEV
jgi:hypothetical protein